MQHRDVEPANLLLLKDGVKVADFGLAKALEQTVASNSGAGTIAYMAPECFKGVLAQQSDQYSLAVTYYHLRTGQMLFSGNPAQVMYAHLETEPDLSPLTPAEAFVLARALSKQADKRWPNCRFFVDDLIASTRSLVERTPSDFQWEQMRWPFTLPVLPYSADALERSLDGTTLEIHHGSHHKTHVDRLNFALAGYSELEKKPLERLLREIDSVPLAIRQAVINHGGGHANHALFWETMSPDGGGEPSGALGHAITSAFGDSVGTIPVDPEAVGRSRQQGDQVR